MPSFKSAVWDLAPPSGDSQNWTIEVVASSWVNIHRNIFKHCYFFLPCCYRNWLFLYCVELNPPSLCAIISMSPISASIITQKDEKLFDVSAEPKIYRENDAWAVYLLPLYILWPDVSVLKSDSELYTLIGYNEAPLSPRPTHYSADGKTLLLPP